MLETERGKLHSLENVWLLHTEFQCYWAPNFTMDYIINVLTIWLARQSQILTPSSCCVVFPPSENHRPDYATQRSHTHTHTHAVQTLRCMHMYTLERTQFPVCLLNNIQVRKHKTQEFPCMSLPLRLPQGSLCQSMFARPNKVVTHRAEFKQMMSLEHKNEAF